MTNQSRAREQATAYASVFAPTKLDLGDGDSIMVPPHPNLRLLDDDALEALDEYLYEIDTEYDREPDIYHPEQTLDSGLVLPAQTVRGRIKEPYRIEGELIKPSHIVRMVQIALGDTDWKKLKAAGKNAADVWRIWNDQGLKLSDRADADPKSDGGARPLASVPR